MIKIIEKDNQLLFDYKPDNFWGNDDARWIDARLNEDNYITIKGIFTFQPKDIFIDHQLSSNEENHRVFVLGIPEDNYFKVDKG